MNAEAGLLGHRVDEMRERGAAGQGEIDAAAEIVARDARSRYAGDAAGERRGVEPGAIDQVPAGELHLLGAADAQREPVIGDPAAFDRRAEDHHGAGRLGIALIGEHQRMAVDDAGRGRDEAADRGERRLDPAQLVGADIFEIADAVGHRAGADAVEQGELAFLASDDQLAEPLVRHAALGAIGVEHLAPGDAGARLETALRIIDAGMDDLAVARRSLEADAVFALQHHDLDAGARQRPRHREPDHPGADDDAFDVFSHAASARILRDAARQLKQSNWPRCKERIRRSAPGNRGPSSSRRATPRSDG